MPWRGIELKRTSVHNESNMSPSKSQNTVQSILNSAFDLFTSQGYAATSMRQIASLARVSLGSIYNHFSSKEDIFLAIIYSRHPFVILLPAMNLIEEQDPRTFITRISQSVIDLFESEPKIINLFMLEVTEFKGIHAKLLINRLLPEFQNLAFRLQTFDGITDRLNGLALLRTIWSMVFGFVLSESLIKNVPVEGLTENSFETFIEVMMNGILDHQEAL